MGILVPYSTIPLRSALFDPSMLSHGPSVMKPVSHLHVLMVSQSPKFLRVGVTQKTNKIQHSSHGIMMYTIGER